MAFSPLLYWGISFIVIALIGLQITSRFIKIDMEKSGDLVVAMLTILGTLVSVLLGLLVSSADEKYRALEECVSTEATSVGQVFRLSRSLPQPQSKIMRDLCLQYCDQVISSEWPALKKGENSPAVTDTYSRLSDEITAFRPANSGEESLQHAIIDVTTQIGQNRATRIVASRSNWAGRLLPLIFTCAVVVLACSYLYVGQGSKILHSVLVAFVAVTLGINIGVIFLMTRPFTSEWAIEPEAFQLHSQVMKQYLR
ncbi:MAG: DUF4239 domain-containing protein [Cyanobacteria bacterium SZAS LIN-3]|nr:DUF4239 domain-containing protein [Cyanobacteria bacterium SZAS LIN-3]MBS2006153.1 DUF4239 domain-containing protein [Cyanobacteria bacterium SZAS TMP-1]